MLKANSRPPSALRFQHVAAAAHRMNEVPALFAVDLPPQVVDVHVHDVRERVQWLVPDVLADHLSRNHPTHVAHEVFEQRVFLLRELDSLLPRSTWREMGSTDRSSTRITALSAVSVDRRSSAFTRATSSAKSNGFAR